MNTAIFSLFLLISLFVHIFAAKKPLVAKFPLQISADIVITAHQIPEESAYPPRYRKMSIFYDYLSRRARADLEEGYEAAKTYIRRYDLKNEYMIRPLPIDDCKRAYLGETMPFPDIPNDTEYMGLRTVNGTKTNYFLFEEADVRVHMYFDENNAPVQLIEEVVEADGQSIPMLTYDFSNVVLGPIDELVFEIPSPYSHGSCDRHSGGFPYLHVFHYFVRF